MEYTEFCRQLKRLITENEDWNINEEDYTFYPDGFTSETDPDLTFVRDTNMRYRKMESDVLQGDYIVLETGPDELRSVCRFSLDYLYDEFQEGGWEAVTDIVDNNISIAQKINQSGIISHMEEYEYIKERLIIRPLNYTDNKNELQKCIYKQIGDIALVLYLIVSENTDIGLNTMKVKKEIFEKWGQQPDEIWEAAFINTQISALPRMYINPMDTYKPPYHKGAFMAFNSDIKTLGRMAVPCITSTKQTNGAIVMFYPGVKERIAELYNDSYYVAFTSVHDIRTHCKGTTTPHSILQNVKHINSTFPKDEVLSRNVWFYDKDKKTFEPLSLIE